MESLTAKVEGNINKGYLSIDQETISCIQNIQYPFD
jgi:hypothetical protein